MSRVLVWKSDADGKLFEDKTKYQKHLRKLAADRLVQRRIDDAKIQFDNTMTDFGNISDFSELPTFIKDNWEFFFYNGRKHSEWKTTRPKKLMTHVLESIEFTTPYFNPHMSNTHSCPRGGKRNWYERDNGSGVPRHYPGWSSRLTFVLNVGTRTYKKTLYTREAYGGDYFTNTIIHTGTGGGGGSSTLGLVRYSYDVTLWAADFPVIWEKLARSIALKRMNDQKARAWKELGGNPAQVPPILDLPDNWQLPNPLSEYYY